MLFISDFLTTFASTVRDVLPIAAIILGFQLFVIRKKLPAWPRLLGGFILVIVGLSFFLLGLERALFPIGRLMATQLIELGESSGGFLWVYLFAFAIGASTTIAEPSLIAVAMKANQVSGGAIGVWGLRIAVAIGVAIGIALGAWRIVSGYPIHWFIIAGYIVVVIQTLLAPKLIIPLAYDSGGVTTSTVTVPLVAALGLGLAENIDGRSALIDGFGLIAFASLFPMITVMAYAQFAEFKRARQAANLTTSATNTQAEDNSNAF
ncbi:DUF1538 domain-containing protein [Agaribacterium haliotis]|uniref:DUF1538 domain-containing protein n=1 Tax=Agaribacterium haliotis TaxID=2013869 RepID=UPI000BB59850|nr:DUF1538 domain-containing protein [Agaribacterium haliotis]